MLLSALTIISTTVTASRISLWGYVFDEADNGNKITPQIVEVKFPSGTYSTKEGDIDSVSGMYVLDFDGKTGETGNFKVKYNDTWYEAIETIFLINDSEINLNINTSNPMNNPPNTPSNPNPSNGATNQDKNVNIGWTGGDPDVGDTVTYDVYFDDVNPPVDLVSNDQTGTSYDPGTLGENKPYYWKIVATDNHGLSSEGPIWSFTTKKPSTTSGTTTNGGGGYISPTPTNEKPVADAGGPYSGFPDENIEFNASESYDPDGDIIGYRWDFNNDGTYDTDWLTTPYASHTYISTGEYTVKIEVKDDDDSTDTDTTTVTINVPNNPPTKPTIEGPETGNKNIDYNYTVTSTDPDNHSIEYTIDWGDGSIETSSGFIANGTGYTTSHNWTSAGKYSVWAEAVDDYDNGNGTPSGKTYLTVLIDATNVGDIGYLTDDDGDETYDTFHNTNETIETSVEKRTDGKYLIDSDGDGDWDWIFDPETGDLEEYIEPTAEADNTMWYIAGILLIIILLVLFYLLAKRKKKKEDKTKSKKKK